jgi:hypothetical protein
MSPARRSGHPPELAELLAKLDRIQDDAHQLALHAADIYSLAYERAVTGEQSGSSGRVAWYLDDIGQDAAKVLWRRLRTDIHNAAVVVGSLEHTLRAIMGGDGPSRQRGTLITHEEFQEALEAQQRRQARAADPETAAIAEYEPPRARGQLQPGYPQPPKATPAKKRWPTDDGIKRRGWRHH